MLSRTSRVVGFVALVIVLQLGAVVSLFGAEARRAVPDRDGQVTLAGLSAPVEVLRDTHGVPHIYADTANDLFAAQGYVHAQERFWEMDLRRHITAGRLAELFGEDQVETDAYIRTMGWRRVAETELGLVSQTTRGYLDAYASGVNAYLSGTDTASLGLEYRLIGITGGIGRPEPWTAVDSLAWLKAMAWDLGSNRTQEVELAVMSQIVGPDRAAELFPEPDLRARKPIVEGSVKAGTFAADGSRPNRRPLPPGATDALRRAGRVTDAIPALIGKADGEVGSNSWALAGSRTESGNALLGNDPHLATSIPSIFMQVGLHCRAVTTRCPFDVAGYSFSGMPGVIIGHNARIAWGFTTPYLDTQDLFIEQTRGNTALSGDLWEPLEVHTEEIKVKGGEPRTIEIRRSRHGPLLSDVDPQLGGIASARGQDYAVALSWTALTPTASIEALFALDAATDFESFRKAAKKFRSPSQNLLYADTSGNIGYQLPGDVPIRASGDGRMPVEGWTDDYEWTGMIPFEELPWSYNPPSGVIVTANQTVTGAGYPHVLNNDASYGWRSQRLLDLIGPREKFSPDDAEQLFYDTKVTYADALVPAMVQAKRLEPWVGDGQRMLSQWDRHADPDSPGAAFFFVAVDNLLSATFDDEMPEGVRPVSGDRWYAVLAGLMDEPDNPWWDDVSTPERETRDDIMAKAMLGARREITARMSRDASGWQWGRLHTTTLRHSTLGTSGIKPVEALFNRGRFHSGGGPAIVNALSFRDEPPRPFATTNGPTMRMMVDLGDLDASRWVNQSGTSGHPFEETYDDQMELWATNRMWEFAFSRDRVRQTMVESQELRPTA